MIWALVFIAVFCLGLVAITSFGIASKRAADPSPKLTSVNPEFLK